MRSGGLTGSRPAPAAAGYGCCIVPTSPGAHQLTVHTWRPCGTMHEQITCEKRHHPAPGPPPSVLDAAYIHLPVPMPHIPGPAGLRAAVTAFFLGGVPTLKHREVISSPVDRFRLHTESSGEVHVRVCVVSKDLYRYGVTA
mmetsp:Transcript_6198/g.20332  ORF Transcript_6198/g.20332 Transcript_6198/m.20332 type:complete len:141 (+) Transcript_6198:542-964(+)